jgi:hypothetical protein
MSAVLPDPAATPPQSAKLLNLPNALTVLRLAVVPVFAVLLRSPAAPGRSPSSASSPTRSPTRR